MKSQSIKPIFCSLIAFGALNSVIIGADLVSHEIISASVLSSINDVSTRKVLPLNGLQAYVTPINDTNGNTWIYAFTSDDKQLNAFFTYDKRNPKNNFNLQVRETNGIVFEIESSENNKKIIIFRGTHKPNEHNNEFSIEFNNDSNVWTIKETKNETLEFVTSATTGDKIK